jgi:hypothetical protein
VHGWDIPAGDDLDHGVKTHDSGNSRGGSGVVYTPVKQTAYRRDLSVLKIHGLSMNIFSIFFVGYA